MGLNQSNGPWVVQYYPWLKNMYDQATGKLVGQKASALGYSETALRSLIIPTALIVLSLLVPTRGYADEPAPPVVAAATFVGPGEGADGSPEKPFIYEQGDKGKLSIKLPTQDPMVKTRITWKLDQAPADHEEIVPGVLWFPTKVPGRYLIMAGVQWGEALDILSAWVEIKGSGPAPPPGPTDQLADRIKKGFTGQDKAILVADAKKFKSATVALLPQVPNLKTVLELQDALDATLQAVQWPKGRYGDLSNLAGELAGDGGKDRPLDHARATAILTTVAKACDQVVATNSTK